MLQVLFKVNSIKILYLLLQGIKMKNKEVKIKTITTRMSEWVHRLFSDKAAVEDTSLIKKFDEVAEIFKLFDIKEVILDNYLDNYYKNHTTTPRCVFETLQALFHYWDKLNGKNFKISGFIQFIDRWNIVAYYISSHVYTNVLPSGNLRDDELRQRAESLSALIFLFGKEVNKIIECANEIMKDIDPYKNAYITKKSKALILTKIFEHEKLMSYLNNELLIRKETSLLTLFEELTQKYTYVEEGESIFPSTVVSTGIPNKIAYLIYMEYKNGPLQELPYFLDEIFLNDLFIFLHSCISSYNSSVLYDARALESAFVIAQAIKSLDQYHFYDDSYLKSNLQHSNQFSELDKALQADIDSLKKTKYTYSAEMRMRTPMHIVEQTTKTGTRYVQIPEIKKIILQNIINICYPIYYNIIQAEGNILYFRDSQKEANEASDDNCAQIKVAMKEDFYYTSLILYIANEATITVNMKHDSIEKIYHCLQMEGHNTTKIEKKLSFYYDKKDLIQLYYNQGCLFIHGKTKDALINVINKYIESDKFIENKKFNILNYGLM